MSCLSKVPVGSRNKVNSDPSGKINDLKKSIPKNHES